MDQLNIKKKHDIEKRGKEIIFQKCPVVDVVVVVVVAVVQQQKAPKIVVTHLLFLKQHAFSWNFIVKNPPNLKKASRPEKEGGQGGPQSDFKLRFSFRLINLLCHFAGKTKNGLSKTTTHATPFHFL